MIVPESLPGPCSFTNSSPSTRHYIPKLSNPALSPRSICTSTLTWVSLGPVFSLSLALSRLHLFKPPLQGPILIQQLQVPPLQCGFQARPRAQLDLQAHRSLWPRACKVLSPGYAPAQSCFPCSDHTPRSCASPSPPGSLKVRFLTPNPTFFSDLTCPCPFTAPTLALAPSRLSLSAGSGSLYQPRHSPGAPGPAPSLPSLLRPAPPLTELTVGPHLLLAPGHSEPLPRPAPPLTAFTPLPAPPSRSPRSCQLRCCPSRSLQALPPPRTHRSRRPAVPQMTFTFSKRMLLTRPLSMAPGNSASSASSTSRWVRSSSGWGCRRENLGQ